MKKRVKLRKNKLKKDRNNEAVTNHLIVLSLYSFARMSFLTKTTCLHSKYQSSVDEADGFFFLL